MNWGIKVTDKKIKAVASHGYNINWRVNIGYGGEIIKLREPP